MSRGQMWILSEGTYCKIIETFNLGFIWRVRVVWGFVHVFVKGGWWQDWDAVMTEIPQFLATAQIQFTLVWYLCYYLSWKRFYSPREWL